ncbi:hypothetical protein [Micromonospora noduli]|uniref:Uncharacterized protein n=1 Tax=Micromonospora noduli TaxID=709876 RepID=A0A328N7V1_9ACTN|nr:hypothetical protein [Micromonospora noduli]RAO00781.1 hypothetical protein LAH08_03034 [Micromonospora noduli]
MVQGSAEVVDEILRTLDRELPDIAAQIREEITRGRMVKGSKLPESIRQDRQDALKAQRLGGIGKDELAEVPYTDDESLAILCDTLLTLAHSLTANRRALLGLLVDHGIQSSHVTFAQPDETQTAEPSSLQVEGESGRAEAMFGRVKSLIEPAREEVGSWH